jgi:hypothetical protein
MIDGTLTFYPSSTFDSNPRGDDERDRTETREKAGVGPILGRI